ncbi:MAG: glutamine amidotransferase [Planctomycetota bacterium]
MRCDVPDKEGLPAWPGAAAWTPPKELWAPTPAAPRGSSWQGGAERAWAQPWDRIRGRELHAPDWSTSAGSGPGLAQQLAAYQDEAGRESGGAARLARARSTARCAPVLLTDGHAEPAELQPARALTRAGVAADAVAIGADADQAFLAGVAQRTGGRALVSLDARALPRLMSQEAVVASRALLVERSVRARPLQGLEPQEWTQAPPLLGFVLTTARPEAEVLLDTGPGDGPEDGPLLVRWRYGLGKSAAFTSDASARWTAPWLGWPGFARTFARQLRWLTQPRGAGYEVELALRGGEGVVDVQAPAAEADAELWLRVSTPDASGPLPPEPLLQTGPGRFQARFPAGLSGAYLATVERRGAGGAERVAWTSGVIAYPDEYRDLSQDTALLAELAQRTGGEALTLDDLPQVFGGERVGRAAIQPLDAWLLALAAAFLVVDVALRRLQLPRLQRQGGDFRASDGATLAELRAQKQAVRSLVDQRVEASVSARARRAPAPAGLAEPAPLPPAQPAEPKQPLPAKAAPKPKPPAKPAPKPAEEDAPPPPKGRFGKLLEAKRDATKERNPRRRK